jgi:hypothetical protein
MVPYQHEQASRARLSQRILSNVNTLPQTAETMIEAQFNADFHGRENNQSFRGRKTRFLGGLANSALGSLIVYSARNDSIGILSAFAAL